MKHVCSGVVILIAGLALLWRGMASAQCEGGRCNGDNNGDGEVKISELIQSVNVALGGCSEDTCQVPFPFTGGLPATGQQTSYGPGSDGDVQAGAGLSYADNGDGTITDNNTGLMWEKKDDSGGVHDWDNTYTWGMETEPYTMNGTMVTEFLATLNSLPCFAGHCDWRIPNRLELLSIVHLGQFEPSVDPVFHSACELDCSFLTCSCTQSGLYWSSTTLRHPPNVAWFVSFGYGTVGNLPKGADGMVRAVRGGL